MEAGAFEPLYCSLEIVNVAKKQRLSERFYFHLNGYDVLNDFLDDLNRKRQLLHFQVRCACVVNFLFTKFFLHFKNNRRKNIHQKPSSPSHMMIALTLMKMLI